MVCAGEGRLRLNYELCGGWLEVRELCCVEWNGMERPAWGSQGL